MNVLSLFNGIGCAAYCLKQVGIKIDNLYVSEIDKYANIVNDSNHPESIHLGCVKKIWEERFSPEMTEILSSIDLCVGGSPCQGFSNAGLGNNFDDPRSALFFHFIDILDRIKELNPNVKFMLENVKLKQEWRDVISEHMGVEPVFIDSVTVSAQMRKRYYWANWEIPQPEDRFIFLRDIIQPEEEVGEKYYLSETAKARLLRRIDGPYSSPKINPDKSGTLTVRSNGPQMNMDSGTTIICPEVPFGVLNDKGNLRATEKATCVDANYWKGMDNHAQRTMIYQRGRGFNKGGMHEEKSPPLTANSWQNNHALLQDYSLRRLTEVECEALQGLPRNYTEGISSTQRYKCLGNGWQCDTIIHIFENMK
jgi:site-specific DNA-cytosine methylase